jgi:hypothetical protein
MISLDSKGAELVDAAHFGRQFGNSDGSTGNFAPDAARLLYGDEPKVAGNYHFC